MGVPTRPSAIVAAKNPSDAVLGMMARKVEETLGRKSDFSFDKLDQVLRSDITRPIDLSGGALDGQPGGVFLGADNTRHMAFEDTGLFACNQFQGITQKSLMIKTNICNNTQEWLEDIG